MENNKPKHNKCAILGTALALAIFTSSCGKYSEDVTVTMVEKKVEEDLTPPAPPVEQKEERSWALYDEDALMYKVDLDKFLTDKLKLANETLENQDVINLIEMVREELGEDLYAKDWKDNELYNQDGKKVFLYSSYERTITVRFYEDEYYIEYDIDVDRRGETESTSKSIEEDLFTFSKHFVIYDANKEWCRTFSFREDQEKYLSISIHEGSVFDKCSISFKSDMAEATIKISEEEYDTLHEIMLSYADSDNFYKFLSDNLDLLNKYLDLIKEKNEEYYEYLCDLINGYIEQAEVLQYE